MLTEPELIAAAKAGDQDAFAELYRRSRGVALKIGREMNMPNADDFCQDVYLRAFAGLKSFSGNCKFSTWVAAIATSIGFNVLEAKRQPMNGSDNLSDMAVAPEGFSRSWNDVVDAIVDVGEILSTLRPKEQFVIIAHDLQGYTLTEAASMMGESPGSAKKIRQRAITRLKIVCPRPALKSV